MRVSIPTIIGSGLLLGLAFPPVSAYPLAWVGLVPLLIRWQHIDSLRTVVLETYGAFQVMYAVAGYWVLLHPIPATVTASLVGWVTLPLLTACCLAPAWWVNRRLGRFWGLIAITALILGYETAHLHLDIGFPWLLWGHTQAGADWMIAITDFTGVLGLSLIVLLLNGIVWTVLETPFHGVKFILTGASLALLLGLYFYGPSTPPLDDDALSVLIVQPAIDAESWSDVYDLDRPDDLLDQTRTALDEMANQPDLIVWPETTLPVSTPGDSLRARLSTWTSHHQIALLTGAIGLDSTAFTNQTLLFTSDSVSTYEKIRLVPFAEGVPYRSRFPRLDRLAVPAGGVSQYRAGQERKLFEIESLRIGPLICFESVFGHEVRQRVLDGADALIVVAQDGWWGHSSGLYQHLAFTRLRAVESRRFVILATVSGLSALISPSGEVRLLGRWMEPTAQQVRLYSNPEKTVYTRHGDWIGWMAPAFIGILLIRLFTR